MRGYQWQPKRGQRQPKEETQQSRKRHDRLEEAATSMYKRAVAPRQQGKRTDHQEETIMGQPYPITVYEDSQPARREPRRAEPSTSKTNAAATFKQQEKAPKRIDVPPTSHTLTKN
jgi:hypothetical protein